jgi:hypothetical protein
MWLLSIYRPTVSNRKVTLSAVQELIPRNALNSDYFEQKTTTLIFARISSLTVFGQEIREEMENKLTQRRKGAKVKTHANLAQSTRASRELIFNERVSWWLGLRLSYVL